MNRRLIMLLLCSLISLAGARPLLAVAPRQSAAIQLTVQPFFDSHYRAGRWLPLRVTVENSGADVSAVLSVHTDATYQTPLELPRGARKTVVLYIQPVGAFQRSQTVQLSAGGVEIASESVALTGVAAPRAFFGILSEQPLALALPGGKEAFDRIDSLAIRAADLPERGEGLAMFDVLLVDGAPLADLSAAQQQALTDWVRKGGQLVLGGSKLDQLLGQLPAQLQPATAGAALNTTPISLLPELETPPAATALTPAQDAAVLGRAGDAPVAVLREIGAGRVTLLGFSLAAPELAALPAQSGFWAQTVRLPSIAELMNGAQPTEQARAQQFGMALMSLPVLAMPPLGVLAALLALYVLIIGPGLYLLLRRLDRQAWGWVAIPAVTLLFSLGTYGYGLRLRGNDIILNQLTVIEPSAGRSFVRSYAGIFSPISTSYDIDTSAEALFRPLGNVGFAGAPVTASDTSFVQSGAGVRGLSVAQWAMNSFVAEQMIDGAPLSAELKISGTTLRGTVRNDGQRPLHDLVLFQSTRVVRIGNLQPGESHTVELDLTSSAPNVWDGPISSQLLDGQWDFSKSVMPPAEVRMRQMVLDGLFGSAFDLPAQPMLLGWLDQAPIDLTVAQRRVLHQQNTLVLLRAPVSYDSSFTLPPRWIKPEFVASSPTSGACVSQFGNGWYIDTGVVTSTLQLPPAASGRPLREATLTIQSDGPPAALKLDLYDWQAAEWTSQPADQTTLTLDDPTRYFSDAGALQLRIELPDSQAGKGSGCISPNLSVEGAQP